uniref:WD repeat-containing protein on Y chromosome n=1 Tax=Anabas testudineus TaxID=64144 RepID=A0AAQ6IKV5_ANATE
MDFLGDYEYFNCAEYSHSAGQLLTGGADGLLRVWFPYKNVSYEHVLKGHVRPITHIMFNPNEKTLISLSDDLNVLWDIVTGKAVMQFKVTPKQHVGFTAISFDGPQRRLITISKDGKVRLWNFNNGTELSTREDNI